MAEDSESQTPSPPPPNSDSSSSNENNDGNNNNGNNNNNGDNGNTNNNGNNNNNGDNGNTNNNGNNNNNGDNGNNNGNDNNNGDNGNTNNNGNNNNNNGNNGNNNNNNNNGNKNNNNNNNNNKSPPPPPPPNSWSRGRFPPPPPLSHHKSPSQKPSNNSSNDKAIIIGVVVGGALLLLFMLVCIICCCCRRKKRKPHDQMHYYRHDSFGNGSSDFFPSGPHGDWKNNQGGQHAVKPPPAPASTVSSEYPALAPPPPPPMTCSSEMSSTAFSGVGSAPYSGMGSAPYSGMGSAAFSGPHQAALPPPHPTLALGFNKSSFTYEDLAAATGGFASDKLLGQGGFGYVHKGVLPNGKEIAVKSLKAGSGQGEREFQAEVDIISRVHHRHLVSLVGYCIADSQRMLVYEFVPNDSLEHHLHGKGQPVMDADTRLKIALGSAKGFAYLHEDCHPRIIHRDIKAANILLDYNYEAKVADFGLAKLSNDNNTHVSTRIMGTFGYLAPEYASTGKLTEKSDVYSYGVVLLELITGRRPVELHSDDDSLVDWARPILMQATQGGSFEELVDPLLENKYNPQEMMRMVACAAACIRHSARRRPKMSQIVRALEGDASLEDLNDAIKTSASSSNFGSSGSECDSSEMKKVRKGGLTSQEFNSSGEHGATGEFVSHPSPLSSTASQEMPPKRNTNIL